MFILARVIASEAHRGQSYGEWPYDVHLRQVEQIIVDAGYKYSANMRAAALLHDALEDTELTYTEIYKLFGEEVAMLVYSCTGIGKNRKERNACIYNKISKFTKAADIKVADRIDNLENISNKSYSFYLDEHEEFCEKVAKYANSYLQFRLAFAVKSIIG